MASAPKAKYLRKPKARDEKKKDQPVCSHSFDEIFCLLLRLFLSPTLPPFHGVGAATQGDCAHNSQYSIFLVVFLKRKRTEDEMVGGRFF